MQKLKEKFQTFVRIRKQLDLSKGPCPFSIAINNSTIQFITKKNPIYKSSKYPFDNVFGKESSNQEVFEQSASKIINNCLTGYNGVVLCYGQTSSGKTYTIFGEKESETPGLLELAIKKIFSTQNQSLVILVSYMEIYQEKIYDLLNLS